MIADEMLKIVILVRKFSGATFLCNEFVWNCWSFHAQFTNSFELYYFICSIF